MARRLCSSFVLVALLAAAWPASAWAGGHQGEPCAPDRHDCPMTASFTCCAGEGESHRVPTLPSDRFTPTTPMACRSLTAAPPFPIAKTQGRLLPVGAFPLHAPERLALLSTFLI